MSQAQVETKQSAPTNGKVFVMPVIGRAGMCNELFPWARAEIFAARHNLRVLAPSWIRFRIGPYLRREPEKRRYGGLFKSSQHIHGWQRLRILASGTRIPEWQASEMPQQSQKPHLIEFSGMQGAFDPLAGHADFIRTRLLEMTKTCHLPAAEHSRPYIAMHVRRGDQTRLGLSAEELETNIAQYTPLRWFIAMAKAVRTCREFDELPIKVFTDGDLTEIQELLTIPGVERPPAASSIGDLWMLAQSRLLFASGYSTFSTWASFLGGMPTIYALGKLQCVQSEECKTIEMELSETDSLPQKIVDLLNK